jgi:hypothetical protein
MPRIRLTKLNFNGATPEDLPRLLQRLMDGLDDTITPLINSSTSQTSLLKNVPLLAGQDNYVEHKLGYNYTTWILGKTNAYTRIRESATENKMKDKFIILETENDVTLDLFVL